MPAHTSSAGRGKGKSRREAIRALKRHLARVVYRLLRAAPVDLPEHIKGARRQGSSTRARLRLRSWCSCPPDRSPSAATIGGLSAATAMSSDYGSTRTNTMSVGLAGSSVVREKRALKELPTVSRPS